MSFNTAVIIAGGLGTRMLPLTKYIPKPLIQVEDVPLIQYSIDLLKKNSIKTISVTYGYKSNMLIQYLNDKVDSLINTTNKNNSFFLFNSIIKHIDEPIIVMPCDLIIDINFEKLYEEYQSLNTPPVCIVPIFANDNSDYIHSDANGKITEITRDKKSNVCASGIQIINPLKVNNLIEQCENFYDVWSALIKIDGIFVTKNQPSIWKSYDNINDII